MQVTHDKKSLINSMNNLIKHVCTDHNTQQQIFQSLQHKDFMKIIGNLTDSKLELRLISSRLLAQLLYESQRLQIKFCDIMGIPYSPETQIILNSSIDKIFQTFPRRVGEIYKLMKSHHKMRISLNKNIGTLLWFINPQKQVLTIQYLSQQQLQQIIKLSQNSVNPEDIAFDPQYCIFGILITSNEESTPKNKLNLVATQNTLQSSGKDHDVKIKQKQRTKPIYFQPYIPYAAKAIPSQPYPLINLSKRVETEQVNRSCYTPLGLKTQRYPYSTATSLIDRNYTESSYRNEQDRPNISLISSPTSYHTNKQIIPIKLDFTTLPLQQKGFMMGEKNNDIYKPTTQPIKYQTNTYGSPKTERFNLSQYNARINERKMAEKLKMFGGEDGRFNSNWVSPSQKVKNIAMNGKNGLDTFKNVKLLAPSYIPKHQYLK